MINIVSTASNVLGNQSQNVANTEDNGNDLFASMLQVSFESKALSEEEYKAIWQKSGDLTGDDNRGCLVTSDSINKKIKEDYTSFRDTLDKALAAKGITKDPVFEVFADSNGDLYIGSDHPNKDKIEKILNETDEIKEAFFSISENASVAAAMQRLYDFSHIISTDSQYAIGSQYAIDPHSVPEQYKSIYGTEEPEETLSIKVSENWYLPRMMNHDKYVDLDVFRQIEDGDMSDPTVKKYYELEFEYLEKN